ncbi:MAG: Xaa-Pro peptidase family protein [Selenomonadaceae bacterium]|nr:Xaa-Pro peptidase family protein [Selenomonadaceae bacterium]
MSFDFYGRLKNLRDKLEHDNLDAVIVSKEANVTYYSGFRGDSTVLIIGKNFKLLITDGRYTEQARQQAKDFALIEQNEGLYKKIADEIKILGCKKIGVEGLVMTISQHNYLRKNTDSVEFKLIELDTLRQVKDSAEVEKIRRACEIADGAFEKILSVIKPGISELDIAADLEYFMRRLGSEKPSFTTIVASGWRGSLPHGTATDKIVQSGELVTMDFGATFEGYCSDITRTICVGHASDEQRKIYNAVLDAQLYGLEIISAGKSGSEIDSVVRQRLTDNGYGEYFIHGLGHGVGLEIHEEPRLSRLSKCKNLRPNMIVTDEPGAYIEKFGGVRIEDTVLVTEDKAQPLTRSVKTLIEL